MDILKIFLGSVIAFFTTSFFQKRSNKAQDIRALENFARQEKASMERFDRQERLALENRQKAKRLDVAEFCFTEVSLCIDENARMAGACLGQVTLASTKCNIEKLGSSPVMFLATSGLSLARLKAEVYGLENIVQFIDEVTKWRVFSRHELASELEKWPIHDGLDNQFNTKRETMHNISKITNKIFEKNESMARKGALIFTMHIQENLSVV